MKKIPNLFFMILCGGSGTRLWPLSRKMRPKQLLPFLNKKSLLEQTIERVFSIQKNDFSHQIGLITTQEQKKIIAKSIIEKINFVHEEPTPRNTGPAILYSCLEIAKKNKNAIIAFLPADPFIPETKKFCKYLEQAISYASKNNKIVTLGLMPTYPATGYGYIQAKKCGPEDNFIFDVEKFHEKPSLEKAKVYLEQNNMFWNLGMFVGKVKVFIDEFKKHAPQMFKKVSEYVETKKGYEQAPALSIDYAVMEKSENISIIPCDFEWHDVGNLDVFISIQQKYKEAFTSHEAFTPHIVNIDGKNNIFKTTKKVVLFIGVENLCVIEDEDVIVVAKRDEVEKVKQMQDELKNINCEELL